MGCPNRSPEGGRKRNQGISPSLALPLQQQICLLPGVGSLMAALAQGPGSPEWFRTLDPVTLPLLLFLQPSGHSLGYLSPHLSSQLPHHPLAIT